MKSTNSDDPSSVPPAKKLRQATLPFMTLGKSKSSCDKKSMSPCEIGKKRKKSESDTDDCQVLKVLCSENNSIVEPTQEGTPKIVEGSIKKSLVTKENVITLDDNVEIVEKEKTVSDLKEEKSENDVKSSESEENVCETSEEKQSESEEKLCENEGKSEEEEKEPEEVSSPLHSANVSDNEETECGNTSINISALLDGDDKDSLISFSDIPLTPMKTPSSASKKPRKLTPKQIQKHQEALLRKEEKEREKEERERQRLEEKEAKRKLREEKEEQRKQEKLEKERKRQAEIDQKNEEKRAKEEERKKKEEEKIQEKKRKEEERVLEKKKKEEERLQKEEEKRKAEEEAAKKKEKAAAAFASFFVPRKSLTKPATPVPEVVLKSQNFMPFQVKVDMKLAPTTRCTLDSLRRETLNTALMQPVSGDLYVKQLKEKLFKPKRQGKTWPYSEVKNEVIIIEDTSNVPGQDIQINKVSGKQTVRAKLLQFRENRRPPYWGTWRKKSPFVRPRNPLGQDKVHFDYEIDSDDEWEEEEPGESIKGSDDEAEKESEDDYEVDNEFFVPHGYLSDEEAGEEEIVPPEAHKERLKMMEREFVAEMKKKKQQLKPRVLGAFLLSSKLENKDPVYDQLLSLMTPYKAGRIPTLIPTTFNQPKLPPTPDKTKGVGSAKRGAPPRIVPEEAVVDLIRLIHGNRKSQNFLTREFVAYWIAKTSDGKIDPQTSTDSPSSNRRNPVNFANVCRKMKDLASWTACPDEGPLHTKLCWYVHASVREAYGLSDLTLPNQWQYLTVIDKKVTPKEDPKEPLPEILPKPVAPKITKFTTKLSEEDRQKQIKRKSSVAVVKTPTSTTASKTPTTTIKTPSSKPASPFGPLSAFCTSPSIPKSSSSLGSTCLTPTSRNSQNNKTGRRVSILVSVPRGQTIPTTTSNPDPALPNSEPSLADKEVKSDDQEMKSDEKEVKCKENSDDECMIIE